MTPTERFKLQLQHRLNGDSTVKSLDPATILLILQVAQQALSLTVSVCRRFNRGLPEMGEALAGGGPLAKRTRRKYQNVIGGLLEKPEYEALLPWRFELPGIVAESVRELATDADSDTRVEVLSALLEEAPEDDELNFDIFMLS